MLRSRDCGWQERDRKGEKMSKEKEIITEFITAAAELRVDDAVKLIADECECWYTGGGSVSREDFLAGMRFLLSQVAEPGPVLIKEMIR